MAVAREAPAETPASRRRPRGGCPFLSDRVPTSKQQLGSGRAHRLFPVSAANGRSGSPGLFALQAPAQRPACHWPTGTQDAQGTTPDRLGPMTNRGTAQSRGRGVHDIEQRRPDARPDGRGSRSPGPPRPPARSRAVERRAARGCAPRSSSVPARDRPPAARGAAKCDTMVPRAIDGDGDAAFVSPGQQSLGHPFRPLVPRWQAPGAHTGQRPHPDTGRARHSRSCKTPRLDT
jgi:hypothetical protein